MREKPLRIVLSQGEEADRRRERRVDAIAKPLLREMERRESQLRRIYDYARLLNPAPTPVFLWVEPTPTENPPHEQPLSTPPEQRKAVVREYKRECRDAGIRITNAHIWKAARYRDESVFYRWLSGKMDSPPIEAVLGNKPHLKKASKSQKSQSF
jgi:hypothetical protein